MPIPEEKNNKSNNFGFYEDKKFKLKEQDIKKNYKDLGKSFDIRSNKKDNLLKCTLENEFFINELSSYLRKVKFGK